LVLTLTDSVTTWLDAAGRRAISTELTSELLMSLSKTEVDSKRYVKILNRICEGNLLLAYKATKSYSDKRQMRWGTELSEDLLQVGYFGLRVAAKYYDFKRGCKFSTCAVPWIRQRLGRHLMQKEALIYVPENLVMEVYYRRNNDGKPSGRKGVSKSAAIYNAAEAAMSSYASLDVKYGEAKCTSLSDLIETPDSSNRQERMDQKLLTAKEIMTKAGLEPKVQDFLIEYAHRGNLDVSASKTGVSTSRASKIYRQALDRCHSVV